RQYLINSPTKDHPPDTYQSHLPAISQILASTAVEPVTVAHTKVTAIVAHVVPQSSKPVDFIARSKAENVTSVAVTETKAQPQVANAEMAAQVTAMTHATPETVAKNVAEAPPSAIPSDSTVLTAAANAVAPTQAVESIAVALAKEEHDDILAVV
ncbi:lytic transglycosylase, partial [Neisseria sp. P0022.S002]